MLHALIKQRHRDVERGRDAAERIARLTHDLKVSTHQREKLAQKFTAKERELGALENRVRLLSLSPVLFAAFRQRCPPAYAIPNTSVADECFHATIIHNPRAITTSACTIPWNHSMLPLTAEQCSVSLAPDMDACLLRPTVCLHVGGV